jgi:SPP1 gp7 family putative phage head morphogenesis protein
VPDPKGRALLKGEEHPTAGRRKIEDDMTDDLAAKLKLIASALEAGDRTQAEAVASEDPELWDAYIDAVADRQGKAGAKQEIPATPDTPGSPFWEQFIKILLPAVFGWLLASIQHGTSEARGKAGDAPGVIPPRIRAGVSWDVVNKAAEAWARANAGRLIKQLQGTTVEQIRKAVADWIEQGEALPALTKAINELIDDPRRARLIAQSETTNAFAAGNHMAWDAAGVWGNKWQSVQDEVVCPVCSRLVGQTRPIGSPFIDPLTDKQYERPGAHPGCRCYTIPVLEKPDGWDEATGLVA